MADSAFETLPFDEAVKRLRLEAHFGERIFEHHGEDVRCVRYYAGDAEITGDVDLDQLFNEVGVAGLFIAGDLLVRGSVLNWEIDTHASFQAVGRDLACESLVVGSAISAFAATCARRASSCPPTITATSRSRAMCMPSI